MNTLAAINPRHAATQRLRERLFSSATLAAALVVLALLGGVAVSLLVGAWPAFAHFKLGFLTTEIWNPVTEAKNHFGELLDALPEDKEHQLHAAFGDIVGRSQMSEATRLEIYRYAIFLLEPPSATPFSPPPF